MKGTLKACSLLGHSTCLGGCLGCYGGSSSGGGTRRTHDARLHGLGHETPQHLGGHSSEEAVSPRQGAECDQYAGIDGRDCQQGEDAVGPGSIAHVSLEPNLLQTGPHQHHTAATRDAKHSEQNRRLCRQEGNDGAMGADLGQVLEGGIKPRRVGVV